MKENAISWFEIYTADIDKSTAFYAAILDKPLRPVNSEGCRMSVFPADPDKGVSGALTQMEPCKPGPGGTLIYLNVEGELDAVISRIPGAGGKIVKERMDIAPHGFISIFSDPEGNVVGLHSMV